MEYRFAKPLTVETDATTATGRTKNLQQHLKRLANGVCISATLTTKIKATLNSDRGFEFTQA